MYNASLTNWRKIICRGLIDHSITQLEFVKPFFLIIQYILKAIGLEALCIFQQCVSALLSNIDFSPEAKLFWHSIPKLRTRV